MPGPIIQDPTPSWLKPENASVLDSGLVKAIRAIVNAVPAINPLSMLTDPQSQVLGLMTPTVPKGQETAGAVQAIARKIKAWHGSPHDFDQFSLSKIGTGEGAQAYGHGLYFAESPDVARGYRDALAAPNQTDLRMQQLLDANGGDLPAAVDAFMRSVYDTPKAKAKMRESLLRQYEGKNPAGRLYQVEIDADPDALLDWDKPLWEQSESVRGALSKLGAGEGNVYPPIGSRAYEGVVNAVRRGESGEGIYGELRMAAQPEYTDAVAWDRTRATASEALKRSGIPGIKYLDGGSRGQGQGSYNYVIFDDSLVKVLGKLGVALPVIEGLRRKAQANGGRLDAADVEGAVTQ